MSQESQKTVQLVVRDVTSGPSSEPMRIFRRGASLARVEDARSLLLVLFDDVWQVDLTRRTGVHEVNPGPGHVAIPALDSGVPLELGFEVEFFETRDVRPVADVYSLTEGETEVRLTTRLGIPVELELLRSGRTVRKLRYESYETDVVPHISVLKLPANLKIQERFEQILDQDPALAVWLSTPRRVGLSSHHPVPLAYAPWESEVLSRYGEMSLANTNDNLYEDLPPAKPAHEEVLRNPAFQALAAGDGALLRPAVLLVLQGDPSRAQYSAAAECLTLELDDELSAALEKVARNDPDATDRAFAYRALASAGRREPLQDGLFDDSYSVRLLCTELAAPMGDAGAAMPQLPLNPFQLLFLEKAGERLRVGHDFPKKDWEGRKAALGAQPLAEYQTVASRNADRPYGAMVLYLMGTPEQSARALDLLVQELLAQGSRPDVYHGRDFWVRGDIIQVLSATPSAESGRLAALFEHSVMDYRPDRDMLLVSLAYALAQNPVSQAEPALARVRDLPTQNYDLRLATGLALSGLKSPEAFPSLIGVLSLKTQPFAEIAAEALEGLTGRQTPGKPADLGALHHLGLPREEWDLDRAHEFWSTWYAKYKHRLVLDPASGHFIIRKN